jgi:hypothetical protein
LRGLVDSSANAYIIKIVEENVKKEKEREREKR